MSTEINSLSNPTPIEQKYGLATQVYQIIWHSITHNFLFSIFYYSINNIIAHSLNTIIFNLAAKLECIGIHTCGSICDGAGENRTNIKSFDWYASKWSFGDIVEVKFNKNKKSFHAAKIIEKIFDYNSIDSTLSVELTETAKGWKVFSYHISKFLRPVYDDQFTANYKTINPITGEDWFFISDPTHFLKNLEIIYQEVIQHTTAKAIKLTKRHIWLTSWSKMKVDLSEYTLFKEVEDALSNIEELKNISEGTRKFGHLYLRCNYKITTHLHK
ncbi:hypothetical protein RhiirA5_433625 [Rhizophagus irregularis]|uniref:Transposable element P transposase-like RNase H domain-containing protein n=1 Tax=Rhizophagus irregularis TaxID=588596 RepID=A0A2N0NRF9_9GLOM|nr:hypothetical protein RhiirA5_433625 [Rhizophagus irregularis]